MEQKKLQDHIFSTYTHLRIGMGFIALAFPLILWWVGSALPEHIPLQASMSHYYHTSMRNIFVGILCAVGAFLYLYKGFSEGENVALNIAGIFAIGVAIFPVYIPGPEVNPCSPFSLSNPFVTCFAHGLSAFVFFGAIAFVCIFKASDTLDPKNDKWAKLYAPMYKFLGGAMTMLIVILIFARYNLENQNIIFWGEFAVIWIFAFFWILKGFEIKATRTDSKVLRMPL